MNTRDRLIKLYDEYWFLKSRYDSDKMPVPIYNALNKIREDFIDLCVESYGTPEFESFEELRRKCYGSTSVSKTESEGSTPSRRASSAV